MSDLRAFRKNVDNCECLRTVYWKTLSNGWEELKKMVMDRNFYRRKWSLAVASFQRIWSANE